jgi:hypothetical protein
LALFATGVEDEDAILPPHPAIAVEAARVKTTRLGRSRFFSFSIRGTLSECQGFRRWRSVESIEIQSRCGIFLGLRL